MMIFVIICMMPNLTRKITTHDHFHQILTKRKIHIPELPTQLPYRTPLTPPLILRIMTPRPLFLPFSISQSLHLHQHKTAPVPR